MSNHLIKSKSELKRLKLVKEGRKRRSIRDLMKSNRVQMHLLSFFLPVIGMLIVFIGNRIYPFGSRSFLRTDLYHQYAPFYAELLRKLQNGGSLFYTWDVGLGTNFLAIIGYYTLSIFNLILFIWPESLILEYISYMVILKMGLAGLTFSFLLYRRNPKYTKLIPLVSLFYAMSGYLAAYSWNVMWIDCIWLTPLILLGIEYLMLEKRPVLYIVSLSLAILSNYYIGIMLCIFCVLYFLVMLPEVLAQRKGIKNKLKNTFHVGVIFAIASLMCGALAAVILIPEIKMLGLTASADTTFPTKWETYFRIVDMIGRHLMDVEIENGLDHWPNIYCGVGIVLCIPLFLANKRISIGSKLTKTLLAVFMLFSFSSNVMSYMWHGFHFPNSLPSRQSFLYIALILIMCYEGLQGLEKISLKFLLPIIAAAVAATVAIGRFVEDDAFSDTCAWVSLAFVCVYALLMLLYKIGNMIPRKVLLGLALLAAFSEATVNMAVTSVTTVDRDDYVKFTKPYQELINLVESEDTDLYRFEKVARKTKNDGAFVGYPSLSTFSSVSYGNLSDFLGDLGCEHSTNAYCNNGITPLINSLLGVKYILTTVPQTESEVMSLFEQNETCYAYENLYTMSVGYMLPETIEDDWDSEYGYAPDAQNDFSELCGGDQLFYSLYSTEDDDTMSITVTHTCHVYVEMDTGAVDSVTAELGDDTKTFEKTNRDYLLDLGYCTEGEEITLTADDGKAMHGTAYYMDDSAFIQLIKHLKEQQMQVTDWDDTHVNGTITATENGTFFLSIPYDPGWTLYVDGKETEINDFKGSFISCDLSAGDHTIALKYTPPGFYLGLGISAAALILLLGYIIYKKKN